MKNLSEYVNESIMAGVFGGLIGLLIGTILIIFTDIEDYKEVTKDNIEYFKYLWNDRKAKKIIEKLSKDPEIKEFLSFSTYKQKGKWIELLKSKLTEDEYKYIKHITKDRVNSVISN